MVIFNRYQIQDLSLPAWTALTDRAGNGAFDRNRDNIAWILPDEAWTWLVLKYPELVVAHIATP
jgi:hypothetical protein